MATQKKKTTAKKSTVKSNVKSISRSTETPLKFTKKQIESFKIHERAAKAGGELARAGILGAYKKSW